MSLVSAILNWVSIRCPSLPPIRCCRQNLQEFRYCCSQGVLDYHHQDEPDGYDPRYYTNYNSASDWTRAGLSVWLLNDTFID